MAFLVFIIGLIPFGIGYGLSLLPALTDGYVAYATAALFIIIWFFLVKLAKLMCRKTFTTVGYICLGGFLDLIMVVIQLLISESFWKNVIGQWTQYYFDPMKAVGSLIAGYLPEQYHDLWVYLSAFLLMLILALIASATTKIKKKTVVSTNAGSTVSTNSSDEESSKRHSKNSGVYSGLEELAKKAEQSKAELDAKLNETKTEE